MNAHIADFKKHIHPADAEWLHRERPRSFGPSGHSAVEYRLIDRFGVVRWVMCRAIYATDDAGKLRGGRGLMIDVTVFKADGNACLTAPAPLSDPL